MRITELLQDATIDLGVKVNSKEEAIDHLVDLMVKGGNITDREEYKKGILAREANGTTGIGGGIAIPHSKNKAVTKAGLASMTVPDGVDYEAMDGEPSDVFFMIAAPAEGSDVHLEALSRLSVILMDPVFKDSLLKATSKEEYLALIDKKETEKFPEEAAKEEEKPAVQEEKADDGTIRVLAVTACPTGIAHTFMAAESLENKAKEMGITLKAETNGSGGAKNVLTKEEIENCDGIIVAADKNVEMARFDGKQVLQTKVADGINKPEELIQSHDMAAQTLQYRYLLGGNLLIDMEEQHPVQEIAIEDDLAELKEAMKTGQKEQVYQILIKIEDSIRQALMEKSRACMYLQQVIRTMDNACEDVSADMDRIREDRDELLRQITDQKFFEDACKVVQKHTDRIFEILSELNTSSSERQARLAIDYIQKNYMDPDLSLNSICSYLNISTSYFSTIFKEETGETFTEVLIRTRMEKAKELLENTTMKNYEIAEKVGFSDPHYFGISFKKMTGYTPTEYAREKRR